MPRSADRASDAVDRMANLVAFVDQLARTKTEEETENGMAGEDAIATVNDLIETARMYTGVNPGHPKVFFVEVA
jgi:hypothetical protein